MKKPKFKVGDFAFLILSPDEKEPPPCVHILESIVQLCEAGVEQVTYIVRVHTKIERGLVFSSQMKFRETELETFNDRLKKRADLDTSTNNA